MRHLAVAEPRAASRGGLIQYVERNDRPLSDVLMDLEPMQEAGDLKDLYAGLARAVVTAVKADACLISILDDDGETLRDISASVVPPAHLNEIADQYQLKDYPLTRIVIETMQSSTVSVLDPTADAAEIE